MRTFEERSAVCSALIFLGSLAENWRSILQNIEAFSVTSWCEKADPSVAIGRPALGRCLGIGQPGLSVTAGAWSFNFGAAFPQNSVVRDTSCLPLTMQINSARI